MAWAANQLGSALDELVRFEGPNPFLELIDVVEGHVGRVVADQISNSIDCFNQLAHDLSLVFEGKMPGLDELSFESIKTVLLLVGAEALEGLLCAVRDMVLRSLELLERLIGVGRDALFVRVRFPFIERLVSLVTGGDALVNTSFRLIDGLMLLARRSPGG